MKRKGLIIVLIMIICCLGGCGEKVEAPKEENDVMLVRSSAVVAEADRWMTAHINEGCLYGLKQIGVDYYYCKTDFQTQEETEVKIQLPERKYIPKEVFQSKDNELVYIFQYDNEQHLAKGDEAGNIYFAEEFQAEEITKGLRHRSYQYYFHNDRDIFLFNANIRERDLYINKESKVVSSGDDSIFYDTSNLLFLKDNQVQEKYQTVQTVQYDGSECIAGFHVAGTKEYVLAAKNMKGKLAIQQLDGSNRLTDIFETEIKSEEGFVLDKGNTADCIYFTDGENLCRYSVEQKKLETLYALAENGVEPKQLKELLVTDQGMAYFLMYDEEKNAFSCKEVGNDVVERKIITLGLPYHFEEGDTDIYRVVNKYNQKNDEYHIKIVEFAENYQEFEQSYDRIMMDIVNGKGTDILYADSFGKEILGPGGLLLDLKQFITEEEWDTKYVGNVLDSISIGDKLYTVCSGFTIYTVIADGQRAGFSTGWTMSEFLDYFEQNQKSAHAFWGFYADEPFITTLGYFALNDFINWAEGTCDFQNEEFYMILEFAKELSTTTTEYAPHIRGIRSGEYLAEIALITNVHQYQKYNEIYNGNMQVKGFPTKSGIGVAVQALDEIGIYSFSEHKEAAWDFLEFYMEESNDARVFPIVRKNLDAVLEASMKDEYVEGELVPKTYYSDGTDRVVVYKTEEKDLLAVRGIIDLVDRENRYNTVVQNIILEEASAYYNGDVSVEETAERIQNRVSLYLDESKD